jgi:uncharacterized protein YggT (Ycf19 family)
MVLLINFLRIVQLVIFIRIVLTWIMPGRLPKGLRPIAEPIDKLLKKFQVLLPMGPGYIDLGPALCLLLLEGVQRVLIAATISAGGYGF